MIPYIEYNGTKYEFKLNRHILKELMKLPKKYNLVEKDVSNSYEFLEETAFLFLNTNYKLQKNEVEVIFDSYDNVGKAAELYELLGAVADTVFTSIAATAEKQEPTNNQFLAEYRLAKVANKEMEKAPGE